MQDKTEAIRAGFGPRAAAFVIDRLLLVLALLTVRIPALLAGSGRAVLFDFTAADILCYVLMSVYFILLTHFTGSTLGKKIMGLHVEREDGEAPSLLDVIYRETIGRYLSGILCLGYFMALADSRHRAFHDYLCDTRVVYSEKLTAHRPKAPATASDYTVPGMEAIGSAEATLPEEANAPEKADDAALPETVSAPTLSYTVPSAAPAEDSEPEE